MVCKPQNKVNMGKVWQVIIPHVLWEGVQEFPFKEKYVIPRLVT